MYSFVRNNWLITVNYHLLMRSNQRCIIKQRFGDKLDQVKIDQNQWWVMEDMETYQLDNALKTSWDLIWGIYKEAIYSFL